MTTNPTDDTLRSELLETADTSELLSEELVRRGEYMLLLASRLTKRANGLRELAEHKTTALPRVTGSIVSEGEDRSVNSEGEVITFANAVGAAKELDHFTRMDFTKALKLNGAQGLKWLNRLLKNKPHPIIEIATSNGDGPSFAHYHYIIPTSNVTSRPKVEPPERAAIGEAISTPLKHGERMALAHSGSRKSYPRTNNKEINKLLAEAARKNFMIEKDGSGHLRVTAPNGIHTTIAHTPSGHPRQDIIRLKAMGLGE